MTEQDQPSPILAPDAATNESGYRIQSDPPANVPAYKTPGPNVDDPGTRTGPAPTSVPGAPGESASGTPPSGNVFYPVSVPDVPAQPVPGVATAQSSATGSLPEQEKKDDEPEPIYSFAVTTADGRHEMAYTYEDGTTKLGPLV